ncbi:hypothetical protein D3C72_1156610 [compost metagenome]
MVVVDARGLAAADQRDIGFDIRGAKALCIGDNVENAISCFRKLNLGRLLDVTQHGGLRGAAGNLGDENLRLDGAVGEPFLDFALDILHIAAGGANLARIGNADIAFPVDRLVRQADEVAGTAARVVRDKQAAGLAFKDRDLHHVADTHRQGRNAALAAAETAEQGRGCGIADVIENGAVDIEQRVVDTCGFLLVLGGEFHGSVRFDRRCIGP